MHGLRVKVQMGVSVVLCQFLCMEALKIGKRKHSRRWGVCNIYPFMISSFVFGSYISMEREGEEKDAKCVVYE